MRKGTSIPYIAHLLAVTSLVLVLVSCCDKVHNTRSMVADLRQLGEAVWSHSQGGKNGTLWYYRSLAESFVRLDVPKPLVAELDQTVRIMRQLAESPAR